MMKSFLVLILEIRLAFPPPVKSFVPPFADSLCVSLGIVKTILCARSLNSGLGQSLPFICGCSSLKEQWGEEGKSLQAARLPLLPAHFLSQWQPEFPGLDQQPFHWTSAAALVFLVEASELAPSVSLRGLALEILTTLFVFAVCSLPPEPENGGYVCHPRPCRDPLNSGSVIEYLCAEGYMLKGDYKYLTCKNGEWKPAMEISCHLNEGQLGR